MQIILCGDAAGYEAEHTARLFFPAADRADEHQLADAARDAIARNLRD